MSDSTPFNNEASHSQNQPKSRDNTVRDEQPFLTSIPQQPQTEQRKPFIPRKDEPLSSPGTARATIAASREAPNGTVENDYAAKHQHQVVLQQHCDYFDTDHDGVIWPQDTYLGFRKLGR
jgi:hypothetical protein